MSQHIVSLGPTKLNGQITISGSKNASLPILAASLLTKGPVRLSNVAKLKDISVLLSLLASLNVHVTLSKDLLVLDSSQAHFAELDSSQAGQIRASVLLLGPLLARFQHVVLPTPGGCKIGKRPIDFHLHAIEQLGAQIRYDGQNVIASAPHGLRGGRVVMPLPSVTATENALMAAIGAKGQTRIENPSQDSEVLELIRFLQAMGYSITIEKEAFTVISDGPITTQSVDFHIMSDRMEIGTWIAAAGITRSHISLKHSGFNQLDTVFSHARKIGILLDEQPGCLFVDGRGPLQAQSFKTGFHPEFPTDLQAPFAALNASCPGPWSIEETIWESRFHHLEQFREFGIENLTLEKNLANYNSPHCSELIGSQVEGRDLRGTCALVLLSLAARGQSTIFQSHHIERGYQFFIEKLNILGANIKQYTNYDFQAKARSNLQSASTTVIV